MWKLLIAVGLIVCLIVAALGLMFREFLQFAFGETDEDEADFYREEIAALNNEQENPNPKPGSSP